MSSINHLNCLLYVQSFTFYHLGLKLEIKTMYVKNGANKTHQEHILHLYSTYTPKGFPACYSFPVPNKFTFQGERMAAGQGLR